MNEYDYEKRVMGSQANLSIIAADRATADATADTLFAIAEAQEARFSRFRDTSELSILNRDRTLTVSQDFMDALLLGKELYWKTSGVFNPLVDIARLGYDADITVVKGTDRTGSKEGTPYNIDMETIEIDQNSMTVTLQEGQHLDFGGYMKGHTAQKMAEAATGCPGILVNLGGDIYARGLDAEGKPFIFIIDDPVDPNREISFLATNAGIATSGSYKRHWKHAGTPVFHILDATGMKNPQTELISVTVIAATGAESDAFATTALILGAAKGAQFLDDAGLEYCFITKEGELMFSRTFPRIQNTQPLQYAN